MVKRGKGWFSPASFVIALAIVVIVFGLFALPYAVLEAYGLNAKKLILLVVWSFLTVFAAGSLVFWVARYKQTSREIEMLREELDREVRDRSDDEEDATGGSDRRGSKRKRR